MHLSVPAVNYYGLPYPYNIYCMILFTAIIVSSIVLLAKYATLRKSELYVMLLTIVGVLEFVFSMSNGFLEGVIISIVTIPVGLAAFAIYGLKSYLYKNKVKTLIILLGCMLLSTGLLTLVYAVISPIPSLILITAGSYSIFIGGSSFLVTQYEPNSS
jgi:hypothetical protein